MQLSKEWILSDYLNQTDIQQQDFLLPCHPSPSPFLSLLADFPPGAGLRRGLGADHRPGAEEPHPLLRGRYAGADLQNDQGRGSAPCREALRCPLRRAADRPSAGINIIFKNSTRSALALKGSLGYNTKKTICNHSRSLASNPAAFLPQDSKESEK